MRALAGLLALCAAVLAAAAPAASAASLAEVRRALARELGAAGARAGAYVRDLETDATVYAKRSSTGRIPASVQKLGTTAVALRRLGPDATIRTTVLGAGELDGSGVWRGDLVLRGAGDPTLSSTGLRELARGLRDVAGIGRVDGSVVGDESLFDAHRGAQRTGGAYDRDIGGVLSALAVDRGWSRSGNPALEAAKRLAGRLRAADVLVDGPSAAGTAPAGAVELVSITSPPLSAVAKLINTPSDNFMAEQLLKLLGATQAGTGSTAAGAQVVAAELGSLGLRPRIADGSGLSRANRWTPRQVVGLLDAMEQDRFAGPAFLDSLAVAGRTGTLKRRMRGTAAAGRCRAKTGTINGVSALAGLCAARDEGLVAFAFMMQGTSAHRARRVQDRMTSILARYDG